MTRKYKYIIIILSILIIVGPLIVSAALTPLVPCGTSYAPQPCTICHLFSLTQKILDFLALIIAPILAVLVIAVGGFKMLTSGAKPELRREGLNTIKIAVTGMVIVFGGWAAINETLLFFTSTPTVEGEAKFTIADLKMPWDKIECVVPEAVFAPAAPAANVPGAVYRSDAEIRAEFTTLGISYNKENCLYYGQTNCTSFDNLPENAIRGIESFKAACELYGGCAAGNCKICDVVITGGTEAGHKDHGPGEAVLDIRFGDDAITKYIVSMAIARQTSLGPSYQTPFGEFLLENNNPNSVTHWHIEFK